MRVTQVISGGQTGADQGALMAAHEIGIPSGGTAPAGWQTEAGPQEELLRSFGLVECSQPGYEARTRANVRSADGTLTVGPDQDGGTALTVEIARELGKPTLNIPFDSEEVHRMTEEFLSWLNRCQIRILNVAGNRESRSPGIQEFTRTFLVRALL